MAKKIFRNLVWLFMAAGIVILLYPVYLAAHQENDLKQNLLSALLEGQEEAVYLRDRVKEADCQVKGPLPDKDCTPGMIFENATREVICVQGYSKTVRNVSMSLRKQVFAEYGISYPVPFGSYEVDHLIPLSLGGSNDIANLFPEAADPYPGFKEKDVVENYLHEEVCAGRISLNIAQERIADNWQLIYDNLDPKVVADFKARYPNWAGDADSE